jgi:hypothetical protein
LSLSSEKTGFKVCFQMGQLVTLCLGSLLDHTLEWDKIAATLEEGTRVGLARFTLSDTRD